MVRITFKHTKECTIKYGESFNVVGRAALVYDAAGQLISSAPLDAIQSVELCPDPETFVRFDALRHKLSITVAAFSRRPPRLQPSS
ncbi:hypothetical protein BH09SUM1_BH09SUM1_02270 [soil metagenome]